MNFTIFGTFQVMISLYFFQGIECCSNSAISFHYVSPEMMYVIENLIYNINPYGIDRKMNKSVAVKNGSFYSNNN